MYREILKTAGAAGAVVAKASFARGVGVCEPVRRSHQRFALAVVSIHPPIPPTAALVGKPAKQANAALRGNAAVKKAIPLVASVASTSRPIF
jgi:hypothetical protein